MKDSVFKTYTVAVGVCLVCSVLVASAVQVLRPLQETNRAIDKKTNILKAAGLWKSGSTTKQIDTLYEEHIRPAVVNLTTGSLETDVNPATVNEVLQRKNPTQSEAIPTAVDIARIGRTPHLTTIYFVEVDGNIQKIIFPIVGKGLWSTMYGFIVLENDYNTVATIVFYDHAETPGLGGEISNPKWQAHWETKHVYDDHGKVAIRVLRGAVDPQSADAQFSVDGLSGATLTAVGVSNTVRFWLGQNGFGPFIELQKKSQHQ